MRAESHFSPLAPVFCARKDRFAGALQCNDAGWPPGRAGL